MREGIIPNQDYVNHFFKRLEETGKPSADSRGGLWLEVSNGDETSKVGVSESNIFAQGSDPHLAFTLLLVRIDHVLKSPRHSRETMLEFKQDWALLQHARMRISVTSTGTFLPGFSHLDHSASGDD